MVGVYEHPADWRGTDLAKRKDWLHVFTADEVDEILAALAHAKSLGKSLPTLTREDFPLPRVVQSIEHARQVLEEGTGIFQFRGF